MGYRGRGVGGSSASTIATRTPPCFALSHASIPYVLWGEDSLNFAFGVPTLLFETVYILVPSARLQEAASAITVPLPYNLSTDTHHHLPSCGEAAYFPECLRLRCVKLSSPYPRQILLVSDQLLHFDTSDSQRLQKLYLEPYRPAGVKEGDWIYVPTLSAYLDSLLTCNRELLRPKAMLTRLWEWFSGTSESEEGFRRDRVLASHVTVAKSYLLLYTFHKNARLYPDTESIAKPIKDVAATLREENREDFLRRFVGVDPPREDDNPWQQMFESSDSEEEEEGGMDADNDWEEGAE